TGQIIPCVFHRDGKPVRSFRRVWLSACTEAGLPHRIVHDFRRTAARNLSRAGVPEGVIMGLCGWKTRSVFDRYRIVNEADLADGLAKLAAAANRNDPAPSKVVRLATGTLRAQKG
ncbi:MAG TPA: tyrosine-type recombinase/integrase, partial [Gemmatimonadales bacterium]|nr:tyrosine-type recombinase/integrase [Gemmatimonadales bacterium]